MCAGVHLDEKFARAVVKELRYERFRACAPSYGVDLSLVRAHAERALHDLRHRDIGIAIGTLLALALIPVITVLYLMLCLFLQTKAPQVQVPGWTRRRTTGGSDVEESTDDAATTKYPSAVSLLTRALSLQISLLLLISMWSSQIPLSWFDIDVAPSLFLAWTLLVGVPWFFTWRQRLSAWLVISEELTPAAFAATPSSQLRQPDMDLPRSALGEDANLIVYSGYRPFVGAGEEINSWSFAMRLIPKGYEPGTTRAPGPVNVDTSTLIEHMNRELSQLGAASAPEDGIPGLSVTEKVFVHGTELVQNPVLDVRAFWPGHSGVEAAAARPTDQLSSQRIREVRGRIDGPVRHCLCVQVRSWEADLVLSVFVHLAVSGATLYLEAEVLVLTPVKKSYRVTDTITDWRRAHDPVRRSADGLTHAPAALASAVPRLLSALREPSRRARAEEAQRWAIAQNRRYDFGARISLRELASGRRFSNFFQRVDATRMGKQIELQVFGALIEFLAEKGLDISDLDERRNTILNNGIIMTGGSMSGSIAAGTGAAAVSSRSSEGRKSGNRPEAS